MPPAPCRRFYRRLLGRRQALLSRPRFDRVLRVSERVQASARVRTMYGAAAVDQWIASRNALLESPEVAKVFANPFLSRL